MNENEIIDEVLDSLVKSFRSVNGKLPHYEQSEAKYTTLLNTQTRISKLIVMCISLKRNPKLQLGDPKSKSDFASMMKRVQKDGSEIEKTALMTMRDALPRKKRIIVTKESK